MAFDYNCRRDPLAYAYRRRGAVARSGHLTVHVDLSNLEDAISAGRPLPHVEVRTRYISQHNHMHRSRNSEIEVSLPALRILPNQAACH
jgi:hypothetical protein